MSHIGHDREMINAAEAARMLETYPKHVARLIARGKLPGAYKIGTASNSAFIIPLESVEAYIAQQKAKEKKRGATKKATPR